MSGNERYVSSKQTHPHQTPEYRADLTRGQHPFAVILGCSDSRVSPEVIFDQGLGDIFVVRVAGNIVNDIVLASIEYAVAHLHTPLVMVLGHSECGAVGATVVGGDLEGHLPSLAKAIQPAVDKVEDAFGDVRTMLPKRTQGWSESS
jgi:carbonic anhydrase